MKRCVLVSLLSVAFYGQGLAQKEPPRTNMTSKDGYEDIRREEPQKEEIRYLVRSNLKHTLYGNPCAKEVTNKMGFEYVITPRGSRGNRSILHKAVQNFGPTIILTLRNGPFWKLRAKAKIKKCRKKSGDYVG
jgi:hypothetical protein